LSTPTYLEKTIDKPPCKPTPDSSRQNKQTLATSRVIRKRNRQLGYKEASANSSTTTLHRQTQPMSPSTTSHATEREAGKLGFDTKPSAKPPFDATTHKVGINAYHTTNNKTATSNQMESKSPGRRRDTPTTGQPTPWPQPRPESTQTKRNKKPTNTGNRFTSTRVLRRTKDTNQSQPNKQFSLHPQQQPKMKPRQLS
jgi:hypothetical protein